MKKELFFLSILFSIVFLFAACSKDEEKTPVENPISSFMADSVGDFEGNFHGTYDIGFEFKSSKSGKITQLGAYVPSNGKVIATLWNTSTEAKIAQATIITKAGKKVYVNIAPVSIEPNKDYRVSVNVTDITDAENPVTGGYYVIRAEKVIYPVTKKSITITNNWEKYSSTPAYPSSTSSSSCIIGVVDFTFVPDDNK